MIVWAERTASTFSTQVEDTARNLVGQRLLQRQLQPNADAVHGEMYADAEAAPHSSAAAQSLRSK